MGKTWTVAHTKLFDRGRTHIVRQGYYFCVIHTHMLSVKVSQYEFKTMVIRQKYSDDRISGSGKSSHEDE